MALGVVGIGAFVMRQRALQGRETLLLDVRIFRDRSLLSGSVALFALFGVMYPLL